MPPSQDNKPTSLNEARNEMRRLMAILMKANKAYLLREQTVMELHRLGKQNFSGELVTVLNNDLLLTNLSGMSKTVSTLITGVSAYIQAEIAMKEWRLRDPAGAEGFEQMAKQWKQGGP
jgi:hypothetical protein